ncbi:hypothetical protein EYF80_038041 [Liparis tanakae]|uniref:Uncharacterized protein n=1 Tax=Liparis tanakae TaxID=230148 RepID=A0A4Z2GEP3_9TELE|nr:hypothetical protein EYF80_038041 [Liparis tanakae]
MVAGSSISPSKFPLRSFERFCVKVESLERLEGAVVLGGNLRLHGNRDEGVGGQKYRINRSARDSGTHIISTATYKRKRSNTWLSSIEGKASPHRCARHFSEAPPPLA